MYTIKLYYEIGDTRVITAPFGIRHSDTKERPVRIEVSSDIPVNGHVWNKLLLSMHPDSGYDIRYIEE